MKTLLPFFSYVSVLPFLFSSRGIIVVLKVEKAAYQKRACNEDIRAAKEQFEVKCGRHFGG